MKGITNDKLKIKRMKTLIQIIAIIMVFSVAVQAQAQTAEPPKEKTEQVEFASLNDFIDYLEAVKKGQAEPIDKVVLEKEYARLIKEMDAKVHGSTSDNGTNEVQPVSENIGDFGDDLGDIK